MFLPDALTGPQMSELRAGVQRLPCESAKLRPCPALLSACSTNRGLQEGAEGVCISGPNCLYDACIFRMRRSRADDARRPRLSLRRALHDGKVSLWTSSSSWQARAAGTRVPPSRRARGRRSEEGRRGLGRRNHRVRRLVRARSAREEKRSRGLANRLLL